MTDTKSVRVDDEEVELLKKWAQADTTSDALRYAINKTLHNPGRRIEAVTSAVLFVFCGALIRGEITIESWMGHLFVAFGVFCFFVEFLRLGLSIRYREETE
ncbi:hypothetical protein [Haloarcula sp. JP-L23]|uniref:hypothetical protein n=1 Tax=Haloarcula sp. JP-L23 TaxID=2716717 RepID=UPI00140EE3BC|nr:hypothetical protein G9465_23775 [Haloarcula sp. JP-L23]